MLVDLGARAVGPSTLGGSEGTSDNDKMLLNCLEHVSCARVYCLTHQS
jgi:hypothetical protein